MLSTEICEHFEKSSAADMLPRSLHRPPELQLRETAAPKDPKAPLELAAAPSQASGRSGATCVKTFSNSWSLRSHTRAHRRTTVRVLCVREDLHPDRTLEHPGANPQRRAAVPLRIVQEVLDLHALGSERKQQSSSACDSFFA